MSIKPILFNTDMVRGILDGRKTVTRRVIKPQPKENQTHKLGYCVAGDRKNIDKFGFGSDECGGTISWAKVPYWAGDILYVRETWHEYTKRVGKGEECHMAWFYGYKASVKNSEDSNTPWRPSIHMPKEAARIWLKVTNVQVKRLRNITTEQAQSEGTEYACNEKCRSYPWCDSDVVLKGGCECFSKLWNTTIKKSDIGRYGWEANPWVFVISFDKISKEEALELNA